LQEVAKECGLDILDYTACENVLDEDDTESAPHYIVFIESENTVDNPEKFDKILKRIILFINPSE